MACIPYLAGLATGDGTVDCRAHVQDWLVVEVYFCMLPILSSRDGFQNVTVLNPPTAFAICYASGRVAMHQYT